MTHHRPHHTPSAAMRLVSEALAAAGLDLTRPARTNLTGYALRILDGIATREDAIDRLERQRPELDRRTIIKALDTAVEALTATAQE